jgi:hypothetical protein
MRLNAMSGVFASVLIVTRAAVLAAPAQGTAQPGQMTQARVWVQNRGRGEAVPVDLTESNLANPLRVRVAGGLEQTTADALLVRTVAPKWEYRSIIIAPDRDAAQVLNGEGVAGWETTGIVLPSKDGNAFLLKRAR